MSQRIQPQAPMYLMWQVSGGKADPMETGKQTVCRELYEETGLSIAHKRIKFLTNDSNYNCDIYTIQLRSGEEPEYTEKEKMTPWRLFLWEEFYTMAVQKQTTPSLTKFRKEI